MKSLIGIKVGMTSIINKDGTVVPITVIQAGPVTVTQIKTDEVDGYSAVQVGFGKRVKPNKSQIGHTKASGENPKIFKEFKTHDELSIGDKISVDIFESGQKVKVTGISKGKGFAGTIKRHNFSRGPKTHGSRNYRRPGSIGSMYPQKIFKGKKMAGRMGKDQRTVRNVQVAFIDEQNNLLGLKGAVPGPKKGIVTVEAL
jgi:large subunit ribosomal protein L3